MFFLLRMAFWVTVILAVLPVFVTHEDSRSPVAATSITTGGAFSAATSAVADLSQFCSRQPQACEAGAQAAAAVGASAQTGIKILYGYLTNKSEPNTQAASASARSITGTVGARMKPVHDSQDTLSSSDLAPAWRGPDTPRNSGA